MKILRILSFVVMSPIYLYILFLQVNIVVMEIVLALFFTLTRDKIVLEYTRRQMVATDQVINALFAGDIDETISGRTGRAFSGSWLEKLINFLFSWQPDHCKNAIEADEGKEDMIKPKK